MGTGPSRTIEWGNLDNHEYLQRIISSKVTAADPLWNQLLSFRVPLQPKVQPEHEKTIENLCRVFLQNGRSNGNLIALINQFLIRNGEIQTAVECSDPIFPWHTANALYLIRRVFIHMIQHFDGDTIFDIFESQKPGILEEFLTCLITVLSKVYNLPCHDFALVYGFILECIKLLIVILSSQMFHSDPKFQTSFSNLLNKLGFQINSRLIKSLVSLVHCNVPDPRLLPVSQDSGLVFGMISSIWKSVQDPNIPDEFLYSVPRNAELLLLALGHQPNPRSDESKSKVDDIEKDSSDPEESADVDPVSIRSMIANSDPIEIDSKSKLRLSFNKLYESCIQSQHRESGTLLLYTLLHENLSFRTYILSKTDIDRLIIPILKVLHSFDEHSSNHLYMSLVILLILSEDDVWCNQINQIQIENDFQFYYEKQNGLVSLDNITLGSLIILVIVRTIQYNLSRVKDKYLLTNTLATLANMSSRVRYIHRHASQRLLNLLSILIKRYEGNKNENTHFDIIRTLLEIINSCLINNLEFNPELLYNVLHQRQVLTKLRGKPIVADYIDNIELVIGFFSGHLKLNEADGPVLSLETIQSVIESSVRQLPIAKLRKFPVMKYRYEEDDEPDEFFIPYCWSIIYNASPHTGWDISYIRLFSIDSYV